MPWSTHGVRAIARNDDDAVNLAARELRKPVSLFMRIVERRHENDVMAARRCRKLRVLHELGEKGVG